MTFSGSLDIRSWLIISVSYTKKNLQGAINVYAQNKGSKGD